VDPLAGTLLRTFRLVDGCNVHLGDPGALWHEKMAEKKRRCPIYRAYRIHPRRRQGVINNPFNQAHARAGDLRRKKRIRKNALIYSQTKQRERERERKREREKVKACRGSDAAGID